MLALSGSERLNHLELLECSIWRIYDRMRVWVLQRWLKVVLVALVSILTLGKIVQGEWLELWSYDTRSGNPAGRLGILSLQDQLCSLMLPEHF